MSDGGIDAAQRATEREQAERDISSLLTRNVFTQFLSAARHFLVLPLITPGQLALFRYVSELVALSHLFHFGAIAVFRVRFPEWATAGRQRDCDVLQTIAWRQVVVGAALFAPLLALALLAQTDLTPAMVAVIAAAGAAPLLADYGAASYVVRGRFQELARLEMYAGLVGFAALLIGTALYGLSGLLLGFAFGLLARGALMASFYSPRPDCWPGLEEFKRLFGFGARVWVGAAVTRLAAAADILILAVLLGESSPALGAYALALTLCQFLAQNARALTLVQQRSLQVEIGRAGTVVNPTVRQEASTFAALDSYVGAVAACGIVAFVALLLPTVFPAHAAATALVAPLACSIAVSRAKNYSSTVLNQAGRVIFIVVSSGLHLGLLSAGFVWLAQDPETGLAHYALVHLGAYTVATFAETIFAHAVMGAPMQGVQLAVRLLVGLSPAIVGLGFGPMFIETPLGLIGLAAATFIATTVSCWLAIDGAPRRAARLLRGILAARLRRKRRE